MGITLPCVSTDRVTCYLNKWRGHIDHSAVYPSTLKHEQLIVLLKTQYLIIHIAQTLGKCAGFIQIHWPKILFNFFASRQCTLKQIG